MKQNSISSLPKLESSRLENLFNVYLDANTNTYFYNLLNTVNFKAESMSPSIYEIYTVVDGDSYNFISYKYYGTINLWWLICSFNGIQNPTKLPEAGTYLRILNREYVVNILTGINNA